MCCFHTFECLKRFDILQFVNNWEYICIWNKNLLSTKPLEEILSQIQSLGLLDHDVLKELRICIPLVSHMQNVLLQSLSPCLFSSHALEQNMYLLCLKTLGATKPWRFFYCAGDQIVFLQDWALYMWWGKRVTINANELMIWDPSSSLKWQANFVHMYTARNYFQSAAPPQKQVQNYHTIQTQNPKKEKRLYNLRKRWSRYRSLNNPRIGVGPRIHIVCKGTQKNSLLLDIMQTSWWGNVMMQWGCMLLICRIDHGWTHPGLLRRQLMKKQQVQTEEVMC